MTPPLTLGPLGLRPSPLGWAVLGALAAVPLFFGAKAFLSVRRPREARGPRTRVP